MASIKSEVVSVRVEPRIKAALQKVANHEMRSLANMIEVMVVAYCKANGVSMPGVTGEASSTTKQDKTT